LHVLIDRLWARNPWEEMDWRSSKHPWNPLHQKKRFRQNRHFAYFVFGTLVHSPLFSSGHISCNLIYGLLPSEYWNLNEFAIAFLGSHIKIPIYIFIFSEYRSMIDQFLNTDYEYCTSNSALTAQTHICAGMRRDGIANPNSVALSPRANYTDWSTATCWRNIVSTFVDRGVSRGQRGGSPMVVNLSFLDRSRYFSFK
jgi:hypothetical protein